MECIVLAGGLGTRIRSEIGNIPKCMALINNQPFLHYLFNYLAEQQCKRVILSLGYKHEIITAWLQENAFPFKVDFVIENEPLGTGGGILKAMQQCTKNHVVILNGDTYFPVQLASFIRHHREVNALTTVALKRMEQTERYGSVAMDDAHRIISFEEKKTTKDGFINGGVYAVNRKKFLAKSLPEKFSFEKDFLETSVKEERIFGVPSDAYFIDIGVPEDFQKAQLDFPSFAK